jgi:hypothetical protein
MHGFSVQCTEPHDGTTPISLVNLEGDLQKLSDRFPNTKFVTVGDMNSCVGKTQLNFHTQGTAFSRLIKSTLISLAIELVKTLQRISEEGQKY